MKEKVVKKKRRPTNKRRFASDNQDDKYSNDYNNYNGFYIYFIKSDDYVKVGHAKYPYSRLKELQTGNPIKLELLIEFPEDPVKESQLHRYIKKNGQHYRSEWFVHDDCIDHLLEVFKDYNSKLKDLDDYEDGLKSRFELNSNDSVEPFEGINEDLS